MSLFSKKKKKEIKQQEIKQPTLSNDQWICPKCQSINSNASRSCKDCGYYR